MERDYTKFLIPALLAIAAAVGLGYYWLQTQGDADEAPPIVLPVDNEPAVDLADEPAHPLYVPEETDDAAEPPRPLPPLDDSDAEVETEVAAVFGDEAVQIYITRSGIIDRLVATIDNLPRQDLAERIRPVDAIASQPIVNEGSDANEYLLSADSYRRYDDHVQTLVLADPAMLAGLYRRYYPLFQQSYVNLGYPDGYFNDRLIEVIDLLLATPEVAEPIVLVRPHVLYEFADPGLEALPSGQKLMIRIGPENQARVKTLLSALRAELKGEPPRAGEAGD